MTNRTLNVTIGHLETLIRRLDGYINIAEKLDSTSKIITAMKQESQAAKLHVSVLKVEAAATPFTPTFTVDQTPPPSSGFLWEKTVERTEESAKPEVRGESPLEVPDVLSGLADLAEKVQPALRAIADLFTAPPKK
jgi:hypothetical protein